MSQQLLFVLFIGYFLAYFIYVWSCRKWFGYTKHLKQYISKHQHHKKSVHNFHISKRTGHKNTRNQAPPFAIDLNENLIAYTFGVHTKSPFETIDNNTKNSVSIVHTHIHYSCEMAIFSDCTTFIPKWHIFQRHFFLRRLFPPDIYSYNIYS